MSRAKTRAVALAGLVAVFGTACVTPTSYVPQHVAPGELTLAHNDRMEIYAGREHLTTGPAYPKLERYVECVPEARVHARKARHKGRTGQAFAWLGGGLAAASLGGLAGLAYLDDDPSLAWGLLGGGLSAAVVGIVLAATSRPLRNHGHGHAIDALNYYNDAVGSAGGTCADPPPSVPGPPQGSLAPGAEGPLPLPG